MGIAFKASSVFVNGGMLTLELEPLNLRTSLDEGMEDGRLHWKENSEGWAEVVSVLPGLSCIHAFLTTGNAPRRGDVIYVNPPRFLAVSEVIPQTAESCRGVQYRDP